MMCPMKISALANPHIGEPASNPDMLDIFLECDRQNCARWCQYQDNKGECAIRSLSALFDGLDSIATQIATK